nr:hypothetical protein GCM10010200_046680 [Actinomadura rugatobispora]
MKAGHDPAHRLAAAALVGLEAVDETVIGQLTVSSIQANLVETKTFGSTLVASRPLEGITRSPSRAEAQSGRIRPGLGAAAHWSGDRGAADGRGSADVRLRHP